MPNIEIYTKTICPYCTLAKKLLQSKGQTWQEINLTEQPEKTDEMMARADGKMTVPEIFINDQLIGGFDDLVALEKEGKLDALLADQMKP